MNKSFSLVLLAVTVVVAYIYLPKMYFWLDDYTFLYWAQQHQPSHIYTFPYHLHFWISSLLVPILKLTPWHYYVCGISLYISASYLVFALCKMFLKRTNLALLSALVFASGYVGQGSMMIMVADGLFMVLGVNTFLITIIAFIKYLSDRNTIWFFLAVIFFFLTLEIIPARYGGLVIIVIAADWLFSPRKKKNLLSLLLRNGLFLAIFFMQYAVHPSRIFLKYNVLGSVNGSSNLFEYLHKQYVVNISVFNGNNLLNTVGSFGNLFFPICWQKEIFYLMNKLPIYQSSYELWYWALPTISFSFIMFFLIKLLKDIFWKKILIYYGIILIFSIFWSRLVTFSILNPISQRSILHGGIILVFFVLLLLLRVPKFIKSATFSIIITFAVFSLFTFFKSETIIYTDYRYLIVVAFAPSLMMSFFVTKELFNREKLNPIKRRLAWIIFLLPVLFLIISHLYLGITTQKEFVETYSQHSQKLYQQLYTYIPEIIDKTVIYIEGGTKDLNYAIGAAERVGTLRSEAAFAVHYHTLMENIILPTTSGDIPQILQNNPDIDINNVYSFIYTENGLQNTSETVRQLLQSSDQPRVSFLKWQIVPDESLILVNNEGVQVKTILFTAGEYTLGIYPWIKLYIQPKVKTQLPLQMRLKLRASLQHTLPVPYYHLHLTKDIVPEKLWKETLFWRVDQCAVGAGIQPFDCVISKEIESALLTNYPGVGKVEMSWQYNTSGLISQSRNIFLTVPLDDTWYEYEFTIPAGGEYLQELRVDYISFPGILAVDKIQLNYIR